MFKDKRGIINDLLVSKKSAVTHITFKKGAVRANHYHNKTIQWDFIVSGKLICKSGNKTIEVSEGEMIMHPAKVPHAYKAITNAEMVSITYGVRIGDAYEKDTIRLEKPLI